MAGTWVHAPNDYSEHQQTEYEITFQHIVEHLSKKNNCSAWNVRKKIKCSLIFSSIVNIQSNTVAPHIVQILYKSPVYYLKQRKQIKLNIT